MVDTNGQKRVIIQQTIEKRTAKRTREHEKFEKPKTLVEDETF